MHICFVLDTNPSTAQCPSPPGLSIIQIMKQSVQSCLHLLSSPCPDHEYYLYVTHQPQHPLSSFEHDYLHFICKLKQVQTSHEGSYPGETVREIFRYMDKWRVVEGSEGVRGFRSGRVEEPLLVIFIGYGWTDRQVRKMAQLRMDKYIRSEYRFVMFNLCHVGGQQDRDKNVQKFRAEVENSPVNRKLAELCDRLNGGELRIITKFSGPESLAEQLISTIRNHKPSLSCQISSQADADIPLPEYFRPVIENSSKEDINSLLSIKATIGLVPSKARSDLYVPLPQDTSLVREKDALGYMQLMVEEVLPLQIYVDFSRKLAKSISALWILDTYAVVDSARKMVKIERELGRFGGNFTFPVFMSISRPDQTPNYRKQLQLVGLFSTSFTAGTVSYELCISFPNFVFLQWLLSSASVQVNYADTRKLDKSLKDYLVSIPEFYHPYLLAYLRRFGKEALADRCQGFLSYINTNPSPTYTLRLGMLREREKLESEWKELRTAQKFRMQQLRAQSYEAHKNYQAQCCIIYNDLSKYREHARRVSKITGHQEPQELILRQLLESIGGMNAELDLGGYFSGPTRLNEAPVAREESKYGQKGISEDRSQGLLDVMSDIGLFGNKKRRNAGRGNAGTLAEKVIPVIEQMPDYLDEVDSVMPDIEYYDPELEEQMGMQMAHQPHPQQSRLQIIKEEVRVTQNQHSHSSQISSPTRLQNQSEKYSFQRAQQNIVITQQIQPIQRQNFQGMSESVEYLSSDQQQQPKSAKASATKSEPALLKYLRMFVVENPVRMRMQTTQSLKSDAFLRNLQKLSKVGLVTDVQKYQYQK